MSQSAREAYEDALKKVANQTIGDFVNVSGDTMTGNLEVPTVTVTGAATIAGPAQFVDEVRGATMNLSGAATITGPTQFTNELRAANAVLSGSATIAGGIIVGSGVTLTAPVVIQNTVLAGATIAPVRIIASTASQAFFDFRGAVLSTASINLTAAQSAGFIQVWINGVGGANIGYIPIFKGVV